jgi:hypothetical protein
MLSDLTWRHWFGLGLLGFGLLLCPGCSGRALAQTQRERVVILLDTSLSLQTEKKFPTVFHFFLDRGKQFVAEQKQQLRTVPRRIRKLFSVQTAQDRREEEQERVLIELNKELIQLERQMRMAAPLLGKESPEAALKEAIELFEQAARKKPDGGKK